MKAAKTCFLYMTTTLMQSLCAHLQTERYLLLSEPSIPYATCLRRNIANHYFVYLTMRHQTPLKTSLSTNPLTTNLFHLKDIESTLWKEQFRLSKITLPVVYAHKISTDPNILMPLEDQLQPQAKDSLDMICIAHNDTSKSVYEILLGKYNFNTNIHKPTCHGAKEEVMYGAPNQQKLNIGIIACISWTTRSIKSVKV